MLEIFDGIKVRKLDSTVSSNIVANWKPSYGQFRGAFKCTAVFYTLILYYILTFIIIFQVRYAIEPDKTTENTNINVLFTVSNCFLMKKFKTIQWGTKPFQWFFIMQIILNNSRTTIAMILKFSGYLDPYVIFRL